MEGSGGGIVLGHDKNPEAKARLQAEADKNKQQWIQAGGNPEHFMAFNPEKESFRSIPGWEKMSQDQKWQTRQRMRQDFYSQQFAALQNALKPGVQN